MQKQEIDKKGFTPHLWRIVKRAYSVVLSLSNVSYTKNVAYGTTPFSGNTDSPKVTGFTLVELLVVIAVLAVLATATVLVLNPAELIKQGRDSARISDLSAINSAIALYLADYSNATTSGSGFCTATTTGAVAWPMNGSCTQNATTSVDGSGWVDINFNQVSVGSPLSRLPVDPVNNSSFYYAFKTSTGLTFEVDAKMESTKYGTTTATNVVQNSKDGGNQAYWYEIGNEPGLDL